MVVHVALTPVSAKGRDACVEILFQKQRPQFFDKLFLGRMEFSPLFLQDDGSVLIPSKFFEKLAWHCLQFSDYFWPWAVIGYW